MIVLSEATAVDPIAGKGAAIPSGSFLCAPVFGGDQFPKELRERMAAYEFPNIFYLPTSVKPSFDEGFVRLDHMQSVRRNDLRSRKCQLSEDARNALDDWVVHYLTGRLPAESLVSVYRTEELEKLHTDDNGGGS